MSVIMGSANSAGPMVAETAVCHGNTIIYFLLPRGSNLRVTCATVGATFCTITDAQGKQQAYLLQGDVLRLVPLPPLDGAQVLQVHAAEPTCDGDGSYICVATVADPSNSDGRPTTILLLTEEGVGCELFHSAAATADDVAGVADAHTPGCAAAA